MPTRRSQEQDSRRLTKPQMAYCADCESEVLANTVHCEGSKNAYGCLTHHAHHGRHLWPACWKCGGGMGCTLCVAGGYRDRESGMWLNPDLICKFCRVKASREALLNGGPLSKHFLRQGNQKLEWGTITRHTPMLDEYHQTWVIAYAQQCADTGLELDEDDTAAWKKLREKFESIRLAAISKPKGRKALQRERNQQVAAVMEAAK